MQAGRATRRNLLFEHLQLAELAGLVGGAPVPLAKGQRLFRHDEPVMHVYFPMTAVCSLVVQLQDGREVETASIGNEGVLGLAAYLRLSIAVHDAVVQVAGNALRVPAEEFCEAVRRDERLDTLMRRYVAFRWRAASQTAACNALHSVGQRACRWLLVTSDRVLGDEFELTHEYFAEVLGTHRQTVTVVAGKLQSQGWISYRRGLLRIHDREALERAACECYAIERDFYDRMMRG